MQAIAQRLGFAEKIGRTRQEKEHAVAALMNFITLTSYGAGQHDSRDVVLAPSAIIEPVEHGTRLTLSSGKELLVKESVGRILKVARGEDI